MTMPTNTITGMIMMLKAERIFFVPLSLWGVSEFAALSIKLYGKIDYAYDLLLSTIKLESRKHRQIYENQKKVSRWVIRWLNSKHNIDV